MKLELSQKERMLLEDQKNHETQCIEKYARYAKLAQDKQLKQICMANEQVERTHLDSINQLLSGNIPQTNQQQSQGSQQPQPTAQNSVNVNPSVFGITDQSICQDILMTEKYVSGAYNTAIFEFRNTNVRDVLNHIQKEEQKHGEAVFQYMETKGMYNVQ